MYRENYSQQMNLLEGFQRCEESRKQAEQHHIDKNLNQTGDPVTTRWEQYPLHLHEDQ